jgi:hypothetical protein
MNVSRTILVAAVVTLGATTARPSVATHGLDGARPAVAAAWAPGTIPANGPASATPTLDEWNAAREVDVTKSSAYHCETKVVREWFRATCTKYDRWTLLAPVCQRANGDPCLTWTDAGGAKASIVHRLRRGQSYGLKFVWNPGAVGYVLTIDVDAAGGAVAGF